MRSGVINGFSSPGKLTLKMSFPQNNSLKLQLDLYQSLSDSVWALRRPPSSTALKSGVHTQVGFSFVCRHVRYFCPKSVWWGWSQRSKHEPADVVSAARLFMPDWATKASRTDAHMSGTTKSPIHYYHLGSSWTRLQCVCIRHCRLLLLTITNLLSFMKL